MTKEEIIEALQDDKMMPFIQPDHLAQIVDFVFKNYHPSLPSNLDEAAEIAKELACKTWSEGDNWSDAAIKTFKAGAEWQRERMLEDAVKAYVYGSSNPVSESGKAHQISIIYDELDNTPHILAGDTIKLIIIKEK